jgi:Flp pilus assembly protein TadD
LIGACSSTAPPTAIAPAQPQPFTAFATFAPTSPAIDRESVFTLSSEQQRAFLAYYHAAAQADLPGYKRVANYIEQFGYDFTYYEATLSATDTLDQGRGNCLSLAIATTALARLVGVEVQYQLVDTVPVYSLHGSIAFKQQHVKTFLHNPVEPQTDGSIIMRPAGVTVDYFPTGREIFAGNLAQDQFDALFYRNLAAQALVDEQHAESFALLQQALKLAPRDTQALTMMAILHRRSGHPQRAEAIYEYALELQPNDVNLLKNYRQLLIAEGRHAEAAALMEQLQFRTDTSPINWLIAANDAYREGEYRQALGLYNRAIETAPYLHNAYFGRARSYYQLEQPDAAARALRKAEEVATAESHKSLYQRKLQALSAH